MNRAMQKWKKKKTLRDTDAARRGGGGEVHVQLLGMYYGAGRGAFHGVCKSIIEMHTRRKALYISAIDDAYVIGI